MSLERRRNQRFDLIGRIHMDIGDQRYAFPLTDLSRTGVGVAMDIALLGPKPHGQVWHCLIEAEDLAAPVEAFVSLMRIMKRAGRDLLGLRFESITDEDMRIVLAYEALARARQSR